MKLAGIIAQFAVDTRYETIPPQALATAKIAVLDCLGVALAGSTEETGKICAEIARQEKAQPEATVLGRAFKTSALQAAFANGTAAHALDFDHSFTLGGQPTAPIVPAIFAVAEAIGSSGRQLLEAYVAGFEVTGKLVSSLRDTAEEGWHAPSALGVFGATIGSAKLLGLEPQQIEMALGITASMAGGVVANFGTMSKPLHVGLAARNGVLAAKLAQSGFTANAQAIEGEVGFYQTFYRGVPAGVKIFEELGKSYELVNNGIKIKPYPCGGLTHQAIDATLALRAQHAISAEMVESIDVDVTRQVYNRIVFRVPETELQGKFCMPYLLSRAIMDGRISLDTFTESAIHDSNILRLAEKVHMMLDPTLAATGVGGRPCRVTIRLKNGQTHSRIVEQAKGSRETPMTADQLKDKFAECAREVIDEKAIQATIAGIDQLESLADIRPLCEWLRGAR